MDQLEKANVVGPAQGSKPREVFFARISYRWSNIWKNIKVMGAWNKFIIGLLLAVSFAAPMAAQSSDAAEILERVEAVSVRREASGRSLPCRHLPANLRVSIELEGEKFVLHAGGMTTWGLTDVRNGLACLRAKR